MSAAHRWRPGVSRRVGRIFCDSLTPRSTPSDARRASSRVESRHIAGSDTSDTIVVSGSAETAFDRSGRNRSGGHYRGPIYRRCPYSSCIYSDNSLFQPITVGPRPDISAAP